MKILQKLRKNYYVIQLFHFWVLLKVYKNINLKRYVYPILISALFTIAGIWIQLTVHQQMNGRGRSGIYMQWTTTQGLKE